MTGSRPGPPSPRDDQLHSPLLLMVFFGEALPTAVLRRGIAYRELMLGWIVRLLADLAAVELL